MRNLIFIIFTIFIFLLISSYFVSFLIPGIITVEENLDSFSNYQTPKVEKNPVFLELFEKKKEDFIYNKRDFLEVNLDEMKVKLYKNGFIIKEFSILTKGDPQGWGGSAVGLYKIMSGNKLSFSGISDVYMPYALRYYGKYYLHGEPYYPETEELSFSPPE